MSVIVGGALGERIRRQVHDGRRPRIDVLEMESRIDARVYDFARFQRDATTSRRAGIRHWLTRKTKAWSAGLAYHVLNSLRDDDVVYATGEDVGYPLALLMRAFRVHRPRLCVRLDQPVLGRSMARRLVAEPSIQAALRRMDWIGCHSSVQRQYLSSVAGVPDEKLGLLPPKVDTRFFSPDAPAGETAWDGVPAEPYILSAGLEMRDYATLIEAVRDLPVALVVGAGSPWSHFGFSYDRTPPPNVRVARYNPVQMRELYRSALFTVVPVKPTLRTCGVTVVMESWAMEKGTIATRTVGLLDYARDGETALLVEPGSVDDMRTKITYMLEHPGESERLGRNGRAVVEAHYNLDTFMSHLEQTLNALAERGR